MQIFPALRRPITAFIAVSMLGAVTATTASRTNLSAEGPFLAENRQAMRVMMAGMALQPSGNVDRDFAAMMIPHHQGAIDMARAELRYGQNELLRRIAQEIIVDQQQEMSVMRLALRPAGSPSAATADQSHLSPSALRP
jgi:uncharacterized protein (DUF305 family)